MTSLTNHPEKVQALIKKLRSPLLVQRWIHSLGYNKQETMRTLDAVVRTNKAHCLEAALSAAAILEYHGFPPLILDLESADYLDHTLFLYEQDGKFGAIGKSRDIGLDGRKPVFATIRALAESYIIPYIDERACIQRFGVLDLRRLDSGAWRTSNRNVWYVEDALRHMPHQQLRYSARFVRQWRQRFVDWKKLHPGKQPDYFPAQETWQ